MPAAGSAVSTPQSSAPPSPMRTGAGAASIPANIPNLGGRRPKQTQSVRQPSLCPVPVVARWNLYRRVLCLYCRLHVLRPPGCKPACVATVALLAFTHQQVLAVQKSMSGIAVSEDAVNMYYYLKAKSTVSKSQRPQRHLPVCDTNCSRKEKQRVKSAALCLQPFSEYLVHSCVVQPTLLMG